MTPQAHAHWDPELWDPLVEHSRASHREVTSGTAVFDDDPKRLRVAGFLQPLEPPASDAPASYRGRHRKGDA